MQHASLQDAMTKLTSKGDDGALIDVPHKNVKSTTNLYVEALLKVPKAACAVCSAYQQDYECLGYEMPEACAKC